ncbi:MAG: phosphotransferase [Polyangiaceae bacterium]
MAVEQTNSILRFERRVLLKVYRHVEPGTSAELEVGAYLGESGRELAVPRVLGSISYVREHAEPTTIALFQTFVENEGTAWQLFERRLEALFDRVLASGAEAPEGLLQLAGQELRSAHRLGQLVARIHAALAASSAPSFAPEPFTVLHQQSLYQRSRALLVRACEELEVRLPSLAADAHREALRLLDRQAEIERRLAVILRPVRDAKRIRVHGDLHLGQVLFTGDDFSVIDFEGETSRPLRERRYKRSALFDVAGMLWSFDSVAVRALQSGRARPQDLELLRPWAKTWAFWVGAAFLEAYLAEARPAGFLPGDDSTSRRLLDFYRLEKCVHMLGRELSRRDASLDFPLRAVLEPLAEPAP